MHIALRFDGFPTKSADNGLQIIVMSTYNCHYNTVDKHERYCIQQQHYNSMRSLIPDLF